jgi:voltage-gated potassium channel
MNVMHPVYQIFLRFPISLRVFLIAMAIIFLFGGVIHLIEPEKFPTVFDGVWWAIVTMSTVGYGDYVPESILGRLIAMLVILSGVGFLTTYFVSLASAAVATQNAQLEGKGMFRGKNHTVIVGWNERAKEVIDQLLLLKNGTMITLIDETLDKNPYTDHHVHFIKGKPNIDTSLLKANIRHASIVLITADQNKDEHQADMYSILTLLAAKGLKRDLYCIVEILKEENTTNAKRAGADEIIQTNKQSSFFMLNSILANGISNTILSILDQLKGSKIKFIPVKEEWQPLSFQELSSHLLEQQILLLGVKKEGQTYINPPLSIQMSKCDELLIISNV